ncbi:helix-turn-helix transcriptional regulator [Streptacidiphilus sp. N1-3]|uniref:Helix-turn-helix transcriptional regulator n=1 Tax=Streptacidiphilus alkalitolerans TaxID=3342712 RepID=A0ABV6X1V2_9ACTN
MADLLVELSDQADRWQASLTQAQSQIRALSEREDGRRCRDLDCSVMDRDQAALLVADLLDRGAQRIAYVRPPDSSLLDKRETRAAIWANPRVFAQELVSRPTGTLRVVPGQNRISIRATWTELHEIAIIDDAVALVPSLGGDSFAEVAMVQQPFVVRQLSQFFNAAWVQAAERSDALQAGAEADIKHRIMLLLAEGAKDETVARRLGISLRTCRRHVAEILDQLGSSSRFQAGVRAAMLGTLPAQPPVSPT